MAAEIKVEVKLKGIKKYISQLKKVQKCAEKFSKEAKKLNRIKLEAKTKTQ